jgi:hypothetical protein
VVVYELTPYRRELEPVVLAFGAWGFKAMGDPREEQIITSDSMTTDLAFAAGPGIHRLISGELAPDCAIATCVIEVLRGRGDLLDRFASTFHLAA